METTPPSGPDRIPFSPNLSTTLRNIGLLIAAVLTAAGCNPSGFKVNSMATKCLEAEGSSAKEMCADQAKLIAHVFETCEGIPAEGTELTYLSKKAIVEEPVSDAVSSFCRETKED